MSSGSHPQSDLARLYREAIRQHSSEPVGFRQAIEATHRHEAYNPQCGDRVEIMLRVAGGRIEAAAFDGEACAICMASASMLCSLAPGRTVAELREVGGGLEAALGEPVGAASAAKRESPDQSRLKPLLQPLLGVRPYPSRVQCALLPWKAAARGLDAGPAGA